MLKLLARTSLIVALAFAVAACSYKPRGPRLATLASKVPVENAFISTPPGGPQPIAIVEQRFSNGVLQEILLENPTATAGENVLVVRAFGPMGADRGMERMSLDEPTTADIRREMRERFPGVAMTISQTYVQNRFGPFGFATGRLRNGVSCIYAWQQIRAKKSVLFPGYRGSVTWRLRFCDANVTPRELLYLPYGLNVNVYFLQDNWNIYGKPPVPDPDLGKLGAPMGPDKVVEDLSMAPPAGYGNYRRKPTRRSSSTRTTVRREAPRTVDNEAAAGAAVVPPPSQAQSLRVTQPSTSSVPGPSQSTTPQVQRAPSISAPSVSQSIPTPGTQSRTTPSTAVKPATRAPSIPAPSTSGSIPTPQSNGSSSTSTGVRTVGPSTNLAPAPQAPNVIR